jgi:hypothetical protein
MGSPEHIHPSYYFYGTQVVLRALVRTMYTILSHMSYIRDTQNRTNTVNIDTMIGGDFPHIYEISKAWVGHVFRSGV